MDSFTFDDISTFFASDCIPNNSRHNHSFFNAVPIFSTTIRTETMQQDGAFLQNGVLLYIAYCLLAPPFVETTSGHFNSQHKLSTLTWFETFLPTA